MYKEKASTFTIFQNKKFLIKILFGYIIGKQALRNILNFFKEQHITLLKMSLQCILKLKFDISINFNMLNSMVLFVCSVLDREYLFWVNIIQTIKIVRLR